MNKILRVSALTLSLVALLAAAVFFTVQAAARPNAEIAYGQDIEAAVLKQGSRGEDVKTVQQKLKRWGYYSGSVDGIYGPATKKAVEYFQRKNGLTADGIVGRKTFEALGMMEQAGQGGQSGQNGYTNSDTYLLARCIYAEARGESYTGQVAVGAVVLNRVKSAEFPNTIAGVIYQRHAFTAVSDGQINLTPDQTALNAAKDAMNGWDPTGGCLYYYNPAKATSSWIFSRETVVTIGKHVFAI
ncbi:MAG TPA: spore cortex-lytic enzyme [Candidatus Borkfalkia excrementigallinarum]|uniref:Spore cortex-lytic enzyme n=1 Tax=Candidatus Borkfalkia excrementigallinarum TaxID=2838506 RepID=A0A9D1ZUG9_9FIRM|nr:spore cortex-lytic enzyme [Candidatus Borkfalkia excrementigallinarum]